MTASLMHGTELARQIIAEAAAKAAEFTEQTGQPPCLATVLVGDDPASATYVRMKQTRSRKAGIASKHVALPASTTTTELIDTIKKLSEDPAIHGILLQHPVPNHINERAAFEAIAPAKDVDGVTMHAFAAMSFNEPGFHSCTPAGIIRLLDHYEVPIQGQHAVVVGRSPILGKPAAMLLLARDATVTICHSRTANLPEVIKTADIVVAAVGRPNFIRGAWLKPGAVVIDAGYNENNTGDVAFTEAVEKASQITPVPGGVGPMTIAVLLAQTVAAATASNPHPARKPQHK